ncbi:hypothetical protein [Paeniglutamicibacter psychrophenolicus]|uniref:hypothetical protein n=1 Tax=Paeniglutamicibacter psychrophenolicus TaxID=257454 RepID=UPI002780B55A|nr:hypothetical protein [Paeniglutamicibacter psychrophenolicus]MDQ0094686.1 hypothetical protein [Paeniglutamicibacter psychrophenolicus]
MINFWKSLMPGEKRAFIVFSVGTVAYLIVIYGDHSMDTWMTRTGTYLSFAGVLIALVIYLRQGRDAKGSEQRIRSEIAKSTSSLPELLERVMESSSVSDEAPVEEEDMYAAATAIAYLADINLSDGVVTVGRDDIPLSILADIVEHWNETEAAGKWTVRDASYGFRKKGKGNHPWFIAFRAETDSPRLWKVSRGGRANPNATVAELLLD